MTPWEIIVKQMNMIDRAVRNAGRAEEIKNLEEEKEPAEEDPGRNMVGDDVEKPEE